MGKSTRCDFIKTSGLVADAAAGIFSANEALAIDILPYEFTSTKVVIKNKQAPALSINGKSWTEINYLSGIAQGTGLYHSSVARVLEPLLQNNIVIEKKIRKQIRSFYLNEEHEAAKLLIKFYDELKLVLDEQLSSHDLERPVVNRE